MRNLSCPYYAACLDHAAKRNLRDWDCSGCPHINEESPLQETDFSEYRLLLWAIFKPDLYERYNEIRVMIKESAGKTGG